MGETFPKKDAITGKLIELSSHLSNSNGYVANPPSLTLSQVSHWYSIRSWKKESWCMHWFLSFFSVSRLASSFCSWCQLVELFLLNTEVKHQVYVKRPTQIRTTWPTFLFTSRLLFYAQISSFAQFFIHKNCFWALLSTLFLFWEIFNSNWTFPVRRIREAKTL